jgi:hypothetical protein
MAIAGAATAETPASWDGAVALFPNDPHAHIMRAQTTSRQLQTFRVVTTCFMAFLLD